MRIARIVMCLLMNDEGGERGGHQTTNLNTISRSAMYINYEITFTMKCVFAIMINIIIDCWAKRKHSNYDILNRK